MPITVKEVNCNDKVLSLYVYIVPKFHNLVKRFLQFYINFLEAKIKLVDRLKRTWATGLTW